MDANDWQLVKKLFAEALEQAPENRAQFLQQHCSDQALINEVLGMLAEEANTTHGSLSKIVGEGIQALKASYALQPGSTLGNFEIIQLLGEGGMGAVYLAKRQEATFSQTVAIKIIHSHMLNTLAITRFQQERQILANLNHSNIARLLDGGTTSEGMPYLVMEYVVGEPIIDYCRRLQLGIRARLRLFTQVCQAISYAHQHLVVHRDIKPSNILVTAEGQVKLLDFGIAKILQQEAPENNEPAQATPVTEAHGRVLTPATAAPEQILGDDITTRTDIYGLGTLLFHLVTERPLYITESFVRRELEKAICDLPAPRPSSIEFAEQSESARNFRKNLRGDLDTIVLKALHKEPQRRYVSAEQFATDIGRFLKQQPIMARPDSFGYLVKKFIQRNTLGVALASILVFCLLGFTSLLFIQSQALAKQKRAAERGANVAEEINQFLLDVFRAADPNDNNGQVPNALDLLRQAEDKLDQLKASTNLKHKLLLALGNVNKSLNQLPKAEALLHEAEQLAASDNSIAAMDVINTQNELADLYYLQGDYPRALQQNEDNLEAYQSLLTTAGESDRAAIEAQIAVALSSLAACNAETGNLDESEALYRQAIEMETRLHGQNSINVAQNRSYLADTLRTKADFEGSLAELEQATDIMRRELGNQNVDLALALNQIASTQRVLGNFTAAMAAAEESLSMLRVIYTGPAAETAATLGNISHLYREMQNYDAAEAARRESIAMLKAAVGEKHLYVAGSLSSLGSIQIESGKLDEAEATFNESIAIFRESAPEGTEHISSPLYFLGKIADVRNQPELALPYLKEALAIRSNFLGEQHWKAAEVEAELAEAYALLGNTGQAHSYWQKALSVYQDNFGEDDKRSQEIESKLEQLNSN